MSNDISLLTELAIEGRTLFKTFAPDCLNLFCPGLGKVLEAGMTYRDELAARNLTVLYKELDARVENLEQKLESLTDGATAEKLLQLIHYARQEPIADKISFYAGIMAGELLGKAFDWDSELQAEFLQSIAQLSTVELVILQALCCRAPGEAVPISTRNSTWLTPQIIINKTTEAWIDSLIKKGLVIDASIEKIQAGFGSLGPNSVKSGSAVRLSTYARSMIDYMLEVQGLSNEKTNKSS